MTQDTPAALNPEHFLPLGAIVNGTTCIERLERDYAFQCEAGPLVNCADWDMLKRCFFHLAEHAQEIAQREPDDTTGWKGTQAATSAAGGATGEQPLPHVPKGFEIYYLKGFDALFDALNRAVEKGYLPDAMTEEWEAFDCMGPVAALAAQSPAVPRGPINFTKEWCLQAAEAEEAGNACWDAGALTQAADAGAAEPVATIEALQARIAALEAELDDMEAERDEALRGPWPEWAERMKTTIRKYSGYDGIDDASDGIDLPAELDDLIEHAVEPSAQQLQQAVARAKDEAADLCDQLARDWWEVRKATSNTNTRHHLHSKVHGAEQCAAAIRQQGTP